MLKDAEARVGVSSSAEPAHGERPQKQLEDGKGSGEPVGFQGDHVFSSFVQRLVRVLLENQVRTIT